MNNEHKEALLMFGFRLDAYNPGEGYKTYYSPQLGVNEHWCGGRRVPNPVYHETAGVLVLEW